MYKSFLFYTGIGLAMLLGGCESADAPAGRPITPQGETVAVVNGIKLTDADLKVVTQTREQMGQSIDSEQALNELIEIELLRQKAVEQGLHKDPQTAAEINRQATGTLISKYIREVMGSTPTDQELQEVYDEYVANLAGNEYKAKHILSKTQEEAQANIKALTEGADFAELAKEKSTGPSAKSGGDLGWTSPDSFVEPFSEALQKLEPGEYTKEPVKTRFGWHVILLDDVREAELPGMDQLRSQLQRSAMNKRVQNLVEDLREKATIDIKKQKLPEADKDEGDTAADAAPAEPAATPQPTGEAVESGDEGNTSEEAPSDS